MIACLSRRRRPAPNLQRSKLGPGLRRGEGSF
jgi:hypothetical protein